MVTIIELGKTAAIALGAISAIYWITAVIAAGRFFRRRNDLAEGGSQPPVSVLKPVKGLDREDYENFRSFCVQDYPEYELLFAVHRSDDPVAPIIDRLAREFPDRSIRTIVVSPGVGANRKVESLRRLTEEARHEHIVYSDADIRVTPEYLSRVVALLADPSIGVVTCPYRGTGGSGVGARLESLTINIDFIPAILVAWMIEGVTFALGATIATTKSLLRNIGGFEAFKDFLADDYEVGRRAREAGHRVVLLPLIVDHVLPEMAFSAYWVHQLRWARTVRVCRPWGMFMSVVTHALVWGAAACWALGGSTAGWLFLAVVYGIRVAAGAYIALRHQVDPRPLQSLALIPVRDAVGFALWVASFTGNRVMWRNETFVLSRDGTMRPAGIASVGETESFIGGL